MSRLVKIARWYDAFSKAFITQVSEGEPKEYYIKLKFKSLHEMHDAYDAMSDLARASAIIAEQERLVKE